MKINISGFEIMNRLRELRLERDMLYKQYDESLWKFESDPKDRPDPKQIGTKIFEIERTIAAIQSIQDRYNLDVKVTVGEHSLPLATAINMIGGVGRIGKLWRKAATLGDGRMDRYGSYNLRRDKDADMAQPAVPHTVAAKHAGTVQKLQNQLRASIAIGNQTRMSMDVPANLFDQEQLPASNGQ